MKAWIPPTAYEVLERLLLSWLGSTARVPSCALDSLLVALRSLGAQNHSRMGNKYAGVGRSEVFEKPRLFASNPQSQNHE